MIAMIMLRRWFAPCRFGLGGHAPLEMYGPLRGSMASAYSDLPFPGPLSWRRRCAS